MNYEDRVTKEYIENAIAAKCEIVFGSYAGDGVYPRTIELGFQPKAVILMTRFGRTNANGSIFGGMFAPGQPLGNDAYLCAQVPSTGFTLPTNGGGGGYTNCSGDVYYYLAFK